MFGNTFLKAEWKNLIFINYEIDSTKLLKYLPFGTELDFWQGKTYVSIVAFDFRETAILGIKFPFHTNFEEINLRFYVKYKDGQNWKRGAVFIKEIVPRSMITLIANSIYNENYATHKTRKSMTNDIDSIRLKYEWLNKNNWNYVEVDAANFTQNIEPNTEAEFITEHYWGYAKASDYQTTEYEVVHPKWQMYKVNSYKMEIDFKDLYGEEFAYLASAKPSSVFLTNGSKVSILKGKSIHE